MEISALTTTAAVPAKSENEDRNSLGQDDFLRMLLVQLEHQDPLEPQDPTEFTAQLAQFSSLEQLFAISDGIKALAVESTSASDLAALAGLVGREVVVRGDEIEIEADVSAPAIELDLDAAEDLVRVSLLDVRGSVVRSLDVGALSAGRHAIAWDGLRNDGTAVLPGLYMLRAEAQDGKNASRIDTLVRGRVRAVEPALGDRAAMLEVGSQRIDASGIVEIREEAR